MADIKLISSIDMGWGRPWPSHCSPDFISCAASLAAFFTLLLHLHFPLLATSFVLSSSSPLVHSGYAASYLPSVKAVPRLLKSLLPGGKEEDVAVAPQPVRAHSSTLLSMLPAWKLRLLPSCQFCFFFGDAIWFVSMQLKSKYTLNSSSAGPILLLPWKQDLRRQRKKIISCLNVAVA